MKFNDLALNPNLHKALQACGYTTPTEVQANAIPMILSGRDVIGVAQTGTGKTAAFMLPALHRLAEAPAVRTGKPRILVLTPTRELAHQVTDAAHRYGKFIHFSSCSIIGGTPYRQQLQALSRNLDLIVATPGRLIDHLESGRADLSAVEMLILDEADRMLDMGFIDAVKTIIRATPKSRQTLMFSATFDKRIADLAQAILKNPEQLRVKKEQQTKANIEQRLYMVHDEHQKATLLSELLVSENIFKAIIFSATKSDTAKLAKHLCQQGYAASCMHGDLKQRQRNAVLDQLHKNKIQFLVATDVAARGIDVAGLSHVINYDFPRFAEDYVHRIGRTGRAGKSGTAISLILPREARHVRQVERYIGQTLPVVKGKRPEGARQQPISHKPAAPQPQRRKFDKPAAEMPRSFKGPRSRNFNKKRPQTKNNDYFV